MSWFALINLALSYLSWKWATEAFNNGNKGLGWFNVFASAVNGAAFASIVF